MEPQSKSYTERLNDANNWKIEINTKTWFSICQLFSYVYPQLQLNAVPSPTIVSVHNMETMVTQEEFGYLVSGCKKKTPDLDSR